MKNRALLKPPAKQELGQKIPDLQLCRDKLGRGV